MLPLYFPRDKQEEEIAVSKLPADVGDENGETVIDERKIRIKPLPNAKKTSPKSPQASVNLPVSDVGLTRRLVTCISQKSFVPTYSSFYCDAVFITVGHNSVLQTKMKLLNSSVY